MTGILLRFAPQIVSIKCPEIMGGIIQGQIGRHDLQSKSGLGPYGRAYEEFLKIDGLLKLSYLFRKCTKCAVKVSNVS
jgi:hypothetical protein